MAHERRVLAGSGVEDSGVDELLDIECVHARHQLEVLVDDCIAVVGGDAVEVRLAGHTFEHDRTDRVEPSVDLGHADAV